MRNDKPDKQFNLPNEQGIVVINFFQSAYSDYLAARKLIISGLLSQGSILANTAIEKYFKGIKALLGENIPKHHDITVNGFRNTLKNKFPDLYRSINFEFIRLISKSYRLRYLDDLEIGFNIGFQKKKFLAELDHTANLFEERFKVSAVPGNKSLYHVQKDERNPMVWEMNYILNNIDKTQFIESEETVLEIRKLHSGYLLQVKYKTVGVKNDGKFIREHLIPKEKEN